MTKVQMNFELTQAIDEKTMDAISKATSIYGIHRLKLTPNMDKITVEYDASRLLPAQVSGALFQSGIPVRLVD